MSKKVGQESNQNHYISGTKCPYFFGFTSFLRLGQKSLNLRCYFGRNDDFINSFRVLLFMPTTVVLLRTPRIFKPCNSLLYVCSKSKKISGRLKPGRRLGDPFSCARSKDVQQLEKDILRSITTKMVAQAMTRL